MSELYQDVEDALVSKQVQYIARGFSIEATAQQIVQTADIDRLLPQGTAVYVPHLPGAVYVETALAVDRLHTAGMRPVPHIAARALTSVHELETALSEYAGRGADTLLLIAGDPTRPAGPFQSTLDVLETGLLKQYGFNNIGFAGHPEGHPAADLTTLDNALRVKMAYGLETDTNVWLATQFTFDAEPVARWLDRLALMGIDIPVRVGVPGPAKMRALLSFAMKCGVANSARALSRRPETARMLFGRWTPENLLHGLADYLNQSRNPLFAGVHVFAFGGFTHSAKWMQELEASTEQELA